MVNAGKNIKNKAKQATIRKKIHFYIQSRLAGYAKHYARELIYYIAKKYKVKGRIEGRPVPHIGLYGGKETYTDNIEKVKQIVEAVGKRYRLVPYTISGFDKFDQNGKNKVLYLKVVPSDELIKLQRDLLKGLKKISEPSDWDEEDPFNFHITIAFKDIDKKFDRIWDDVRRHSNEIQEHLFVITILGTRNKIINEYDLILKKMLERDEARSREYHDKRWNEYHKLLGIN
jgi:2'-5' RNA ligase